MTEFALVWEDREIRFDIPYSILKLRSGEKLVDRMDAVEDSKGNSGDKGRLLITNIILMWHSHATPRVNLTIGYNCIINMSIKTVISKLRATTDALHIMAANGSSKFEFIFTDISLLDKKHFSLVIGVHKAYTSTKMYRDLKLRASILNSGALSVLKNEQVYQKVNGVWNLSSDQGNLGTFLITNIRIVWYADLNECFNITLPYMQIVTIQVRDSKFGPALVIIVSEQSGGYLLGFRIDPEDRLGAVYKELISLHSVYSQNPIFGVEYSLKDQVFSPPPADPNFEDVQELDKSKDTPSTLTTYIAEGEHSVDRVPIYSKDLGLAIETPRNGYTIKSLWEVMPSSS
ncbi:Bardet-Biedl syndrome 5 protein homolog [Ctenocephalides felis]|uniref:Bardet-Biedl syndrome 5 protein homolog n=1 Tax=Ctenocephalides felis TaxID=7515 RepID=UPI000E6E4D72|nr:Bardet-Biedl syndrome 5 protein homolog [Ctenocephalides felis]